MEPVDADPMAQVPALPVAIFESEALEVYRTVEEACSSLEAIDVENQEYVAFDAKGRVLDIVTSGYDVTGMVVRAGVEPRVDELFGRLKEFVMSVDRPELQRVSAAVSVSDLMFGLVEFFERGR